jgi:hypothetical protein
MRKKIYVVLLLSLMLLGSSCNIENEDDPINEYGNIDLNKVPYNKLSDYRFFTGDMNELNPAQGVYSYDLTAPLFSDYTAKERFIYLPSELINPRFTALKNFVLVQFWHDTVTNGFNSPPPSFVTAP